MTDDLRRDAHTALLIALAVTGAIAAAAIAVRLAAGAPARALLGYRFPRQEPSLGAAAAILATNARKLAGLYGLALAAQAPRLTATTRTPRRSVRALRVACDAGALGLLGPSAALVAAALGAYGARMAAAMLPHGPVELAAFALALSVYRDARRRPIRPARAIACAAAGLLLLALAAALETYAALPA
jgi:hypothetical protein